MNWEAVGAIAELLGAAAVVVSLLYVATQVRESTRQARRDASRDLTARISEVSLERWEQVVEVGADFLARPLGGSIPVARAPDIQLRVARAYEQLGRHAEAARLYGAYAEVRSGGDPGVQDDVRDAERRAEELTANASLTRRWPDGPSPLRLPEPMFSPARGARAPCRSRALPPRSLEETCT